MHHILSLVLLLNLSDFGLSSAISQITSPPQARDNSVELTIGELSEFQKTTKGVPTPAGTSVAVYPTDAKTIPDDGIYLLLGPDIQKSLQDSVNNDCKDVNDPKCIDSVRKVFGNDNNELVSRAVTGWFSLKKASGAVGSIFFGTLAYLVAVLDNRNGANQPKPLNIHFPSSVLSQINSASTASNMVFKTADSDSKPVSVHVTATDAGSPSPTSGGSLSIVTADTDGHAEGDIEIDAPSDDTANAINEFFKKGKCQGPPSKREADLDKRLDNIADCLVDNFQEVLNAMGVNGPLNGLAESAMQVARDFPLPEFQGQQYNAAFSQALVLGANRVPNALPGIDQRQIVPTATYIFLLAVAEYTQIYMKTRMIILGADLLLKNQPFKFECPARDSRFFPKCDIFICQGKDGKCTNPIMKPCPCGGDDNGNCPTDVQKKPLCKDCDGKDGKCTSGVTKDCDCIADAKAYVHPIEPPGWLDKLQKIVQDVGIYNPSSKKPSTSPKCDMNSASLIFYNAFRDVYKNFCDTVSKDAKTKLAQIVDNHGNVIPPRRKQSSMVKRTPPPDPNANDGYTFGLQWSGGDGSCSSGCKESFDTMTSSPCGHLGGEQNNMANSVEYDTGCGIYSYKINPPPGTIKPKAGPIVCNSFDPYYKNTTNCWHDIHSDSVDACVKNFNVQLPGNGNVVDSTTHNFTQVYREGGGKKGVTYMVNIGWIPGCTDLKTMVADNPQGKSGDNPAQSISCTDIFKGTYNKCGDNNGIGGYQDYGCLRYGFYPTNIDGVFGTPPNPKKFWDSGESVCDPVDLANNKRLSSGG